MSFKYFDRHYSDGCLLYSHIELRISYKYLHAVYRSPDFDFNEHWDNNMVLG